MLYKTWYLCGLVLYIFGLLQSLLYLFCLIGNI